LKPILLILFLFVGLVLLTHFIQNAGDNAQVKVAKRWLVQHGFHLFGASSSLDLVLDLTNLPHWGGNAAPVAGIFRDLITDDQRYGIYWQLLQPGITKPTVDFKKNALALVCTGPRTTPGYLVKFKRMENYPDKTILLFDEAVPTAEQAAVNAVTRPWVLQLVPKPDQPPVLIQKIQ